MVSFPLTRHSILLLSDTGQWICEQRIWTNVMVISQPALHHWQLWGVMVTGVTDIIPLRAVEKPWKRKSEFHPTLTVSQSSLLITGQEKRTCWPRGRWCNRAFLHPSVTSHQGPRLEVTEQRSYNMWVFVDVVQVQGQDVILAAHVHAVVVLVHPQDSVVWRVDEEGEVMSGSSRSQLCLTKMKRSINDSCAAQTHTHTHTHYMPTNASTNATFLLPLLPRLHTHMDLSDGFPPTHL